MISTKKSIFMTISSISPLKIAQILFLAIPGFVCSYIYFMSIGKSMDAILNDPIITVHFLTVLTYPFCYLICKNCSDKLKKDKNDDIYIVKLLLITISQILSLNFVCAGLIIYSLIKEYGARCIKIDLKNISIKNTIIDIIGILLIILVISFTLFAKLRLNII